MRFNSRQRNTEPEWMDDPSIDYKTLDAAVADINTCNKILGGYVFTKNAILEIIKKDPKRTYKIMDFGCSDGAMLRYLKKRTTRIQLRNGRY